ncbi:MAG: DMT family transporter [Alphaproteobacteria bacterium]
MPAPARGIAWMVASTVCFALTFGLIRHLSVKFHVFELVLFRALLGIAFMLPWLWRSGIGALRVHAWGHYVLRALIGYVAMVAWYYALSVMVLADASALQFTMPLWAMVLAVLVLGEKAGAHRWTATVVGFAGALIIIRPGFAETGAVALLALAAAALYAACNITTKVLVAGAAPAPVTFNGFIFGLPLALGPAVYNWTMPGWSDAPWLVAFGLATVGAHIALSRALAAADASLVGPVDYLRLPCVAAIGFVFFNEAPDIWTWAGASVIVASTWYLTVSERNEPGKT